MMKASAVGLPLAMQERLIPATCAGYLDREHEKVSSIGQKFFKASK
jgi:hypothetical protein